MGNLILGKFHRLIAAKTSLKLLSPASIFSMISSTSSSGSGQLSKSASDNLFCMCTYAIITQGGTKTPDARDNGFSVHYSDLIKFIIR